MESGTEIVFIVALGVLLLGPKRLHTLLGHMGRAKARFEQPRRSFKSQLEAELDTALSGGKTDGSQPLDGAQ